MDDRPPESRPRRMYACSFPKGGKRMREEGRVEEVRGTGVVGFQPILEKGAHFEYTSQAPLRRLKGTMGGSFAVVGQTSKRENRKTGNREFLISRYPVFSISRFPVFPF